MTTESLTELYSIKRKEQDDTIFTLVKWTAEFGSVQICKSARLGSVYLYVTPNDEHSMYIRLGMLVQKDIERIIEIVRIISKISKPKEVIYAAHKRHMSVIDTEE